MKLSAVKSVSYRKQEEYRFQKFGFEGVWKFEYFFDMGTLLNKNIWRLYINKSDMIITIKVDLPHSQTHRQSLQQTTFTH